MKKYTILFCFDACMSVEVLAESEEEAKDKARAIPVNKEQLEIEQNEETIVEAVAVPDLKAVISQAEAIVQRLGNVALDPWPTITAESWNGSEMEHKQETIESIYWNEDRDEIGFNTGESAADYGLSEVPEIEQYFICQAIIKKGGHNA